MFLILTIIIMLYIKNYCISTAETFDAYTFIEALGIPMVLIILVASEMGYQKYIRRLESYQSLYWKSLYLLVCLSISASLFFILISIFLSYPIQAKICGPLSLVPYYVCWMIVAGFFIYISPGLFDEANQIPFY